MASRKDILKNKEFILFLANSLEDAVLQDMYRFYLTGITPGQIKMLVAMNKPQGKHEDA